MDCGCCYVPTKKIDRVYLPCDHWICKNCTNRYVKYDDNKKITKCQKCLIYHVDVIETNIYNCFCYIIISIFVVNFFYKYFII